MTELDSEERDKGLHRKKRAQNAGSAIFRGKGPYWRSMGCWMVWSWLFRRLKGLFYIGGMVFFRRNFKRVQDIPACHFFWQGVLRTAHGFGGGCGEQKCSYDIRGWHTTLNLIYQVVICKEELCYRVFYEVYTTVYYCSRHYSTKIRNFDPWVFFIKYKEW